MSQKNNHNVILFVLGLGSLLGILNQMIFNVALPTMTVEFGVPLSKVQWLASGYMLAAGMTIPFVGYFGDRFGYKRLYLFILITVLVCSIVGVFAWCIEFLIVVRFITGLACGMIASLSLAMMYRYLPVGQHANAAAIWGTANIIGSILPSLLTGVILSVANWKFLLLFVIPFLLVDLFFCIRVLPTDTEFKAGKLDFVGMFLLSAGSFIMLLACSNLSKWGLSIKFFAVLICGFALIVIYCLLNKSNEHAVLNLSILRYKRYCAAFIAFGVNTMAVCIVAFLMPLFLQNGLGITPLMTGLVMLPSSIVSVVTMMIAGKWYYSLGEKKLGVLGIAIVIIGSIPFLFATPSMAILLFIIVQCVRSFGMAIFNLVSTNAQMSAVPVELAGHASSMTSWFGTMANALVVGIASSIVDLRISASGAVTPGEIAWAYTDSTNLIVAISCIALAAIIPLGLKFFRTKAELNQ